MCLQARPNNWKGAGCTKVIRAPCNVFQTLGAAALKAAAAEKEVAYIRDYNT